MRLGFSVNRIQHILISHLHGDHFLGLMGLIYTMHLHHRGDDLHIYSHRGLDTIITTQFRYSRTAPTYRIRYHELGMEREVIHSGKHFSVETIPLKHKIPCSGFLFREHPKPRRIDKTRLPEGLTFEQMTALKNGEDLLDDGGRILFPNKSLTLDPRRSRSYAYCSDTAYSTSVVNQVRDVDLLYHEATFLKEHKDKAALTGHSTAEEAATVAKQCHAGKLLLGHFSARYQDIEPLLSEAIPVFKNTYLARDGEQFDLEA